MMTVEDSLSFADRMYTKSSFAGVLAAEVRRLREENERKNRLFADAVSALAAIDAALGMPEDGCNSTDKTITAIKLMHAVRVDDEKEITRLTEENERLRKDADRYRWLRNKVKKAPANRDGPSHPQLFFEWDIWDKSPETHNADGLDSAIDAARGAK